MIGPTWILDLYEPTNSESILRTFAVEYSEGCVEDVGLEDILNSSRKNR